MAPAVPALAQSDSKAKFLERLCLDERIEQHARLYRRMKVGHASKRSDEIELMRQ